MTPERFFVVKHVFDPTKLTSHQVLVQGPMTLEGATLFASAAVKKQTSPYIGFSVMELIEQEP